MAFPTSLTNAIDGATTVAAAHINNLEAKVGIDGSAVTTSHDYKLSGVTGTDKAVSRTGTETLTNKTLTLPTLSSGILSFNAPEGFLMNGKISATVASNNLTVAIKGMNGSDPSATNPVYVRIGDTIRSITAALSTGSIGAGNNYFNMGAASLATKEVDVFCYLQFQTSNSTVQFLISRVPYAKVMGDFYNTGTPATNEKGYISSGSAPATATDSVVNVGRFAATLSAGAGYTWSVPTFTSANLIQRPIYETRWLDFTPQYTWTNGPTTTTDVARYCIRGATAFMHTTRSGTANGSNSTGLVLPLPMALASSAYTSSVFSGCAVSAYVNTTGSAGGEVTAFGSNYSNQSNIYVSWAAAKPVLAGISCMWEI